MSSKIGFRVYLLTLSKERDRKPLPFDSEGITTPVPTFLTKFVEEHSQANAGANKDAERQRTWYFDPKPTQETGTDKGYIRYGTFGFESDLVDSKTKAHKYRRETNDVEIIPLFYEFWQPQGLNHAFAAFQSFQGRSCIELVTSRMCDAFSKQNPKFKLIIKKLLPTGSGGIYGSASVKSLRLIKKNAPSDVADKYLKSHTDRVIDFEITLTAHRKGFLGKLSALTDFMKSATSGVVEHDGVVFEEAVAEIDFGGRRRRVGIFGHNSDAGVIDLTDSIERGSDGHPTFDSMSKELANLLMEFQTVLGKRPP